MSLTLRQPTPRSYHSVHNYSPPTPPASSEFSPRVRLTHLFPMPKVAEPQSSAFFTVLPSPSPSMTAPHRGLPPVAAMALGQPAAPTNIHSQPSSTALSLSQIPPPPQLWHGPEDAMKHWLAAKGEEERRKQEEERTRQESLRLEQRRIEQDMLRSSLQAGVPPHLVPMIFTGMAARGLPDTSGDWAQSRPAERQPAQRSSGPLGTLTATTSAVTERGGHPRESETSQAYAAAPHRGSIMAGAPPMMAPNASGFPLSPRSRQAGVAPDHTPRHSQAAHLPRLNTAEPAVHPSVGVPGAPVQAVQTAHSIQSSHPHEAQSSPNLLFHHWQPPSVQGTGGASGTHPITPSDHVASPKKRKAGPPPTSNPHYTSPPYTQGPGTSTPSHRRRGHSRHLSDVGIKSVSGDGRGTSNRGHRQSEGHADRGSPRREQSPARHHHAHTGVNPVSAVLDASDTRPRDQALTRHLQRTYSERHTPDVEEPRRKPKRENLREA